MKKLTKRQIPLFALAGLGPNLMMTLVTAHLNDALIAPSGVNPIYTFTGSCIVSVVVFSVLFTLAKLIDGVIDIPLAYLSDRLKCKMGKRRMSILLGFIPMVISFILIWTPFSTQEGSMFNTVFNAILLVIFYSSYTMCLVSYYGSFAHIVESEKDRIRLSQFKSFFDTVQYCFAYALFPLVIGAVGGISKVMYMLAPLFITMLIPLFLIKEEHFGSDVDEKVPFLTSLKLALTSKPFLGWLLTLFVLHMGMMLFLTGINTSISSGLMALEPWQTTIMNTAAFAPVPIMLIIFNRVKKKRNLRFAFQTALLAFALAMFTFAAAWKAFWPDSWMPRFIIGIIAGTIGSYAIGAFFMMPYVIPSQIAANEMLTAKKDHSAMYFAVQGLATQIAAALSTGVLYINLVSSSTVERNIVLFGLDHGEYFLVPVIAGILCLAAFVCSFAMKKDYAELAPIVETK